MFEKWPGSFTYIIIATKQKNDFKWSKYGYKIRDGNLLLSITKWQYYNNLIENYKISVFDYFFTLHIFIPVCKLWSIKQKPLSSYQIGVFYFIIFALNKNIETNQEQKYLQAYQTSHNEINHYFG